MSVQSEITRLTTAKSDIAASITNKGVTVPSGTKLDGMAALIDSIESGGGGGVSIETSNFSANIDSKIGHMNVISYTRFYNGVIEHIDKKVNFEGSIEVSNVLDNSLVCVFVFNNTKFYAHSCDTSGVEIFGEFYTPDGVYTLLILKKLDGNATLYIK